MTILQKQPKNMYIWKEWTPITTSWVYRSEYLWLISYSSDWNTWVTMADKNQWASKVYNFLDALSSANCGCFFQRWNNYWFPVFWAVTTSWTRVDASTYWPWNYYSSNTFITSYSWDTSWNANLWGDTTNTNEARKWPCADGFHIPSNSELTALNTYVNSLWLNRASEWYMILFKMPKIWRRMYSNWDTTIWESDAWYTSSTQQNWSYNYMLRFSDWSSINGFDKWYWYWIRPFKNTPVQPDNSWEKLR